MHEVNITISGGAKTGKTSVAAIIGHALEEMGFKPQFIRDDKHGYPRLVPKELLRAYHERGSRVAALKDKITINIREEQAPRG